MRRIKDIAVVDPGYPFRGKIEELITSDILAVQMRDISVQNSVNWASCIKTELTGKRSPSFLKTGDILFAARGSNNYAVMVDGELEKRNLKAVAAPHFFILRLKDTSVLPEYLVWFLNQLPCQRYFEQNSEGSLTKSIRRAVLEVTQIAIPSITEQKSVVGLAKIIKKERLIAEELIQNGQYLMNVIAKDLLTVRRGKVYE